MDAGSALEGQHAYMAQASSRPKPMVVVERDWEEILVMDIPELCTIRTSLSSAMHTEVVEICLSSFMRTTKFIECTTRSWPCCAASDLADQFKARIQDFYNAHFTPGQWLNHGFVPFTISILPHSCQLTSSRYFRSHPSSETFPGNLTCRERLQQSPISLWSATNMTKYDEEDTLAVKLLVEKAILGRNRLATGCDDHQARDEIRRLEQDLQAHRSQAPSTADRAAKLNELLSVLAKYAKAKSRELRWRVRFASLCVDVLKRREGTSERKSNADQHEYQRRKETSAIMLNNIVSELAPYLGAYALVFFLVAGAADYSYHNLGRRNGHRRQRCTALAAQELLKMEIRFRRDQLWFHPGALISWFLRGWYSEICEALGLGVFADWYLDKQGLGDDVPWALPPGLLFARKPAQSVRVEGDDQHIILNPHGRQAEAPLSPNMSVDLPRKRLRIYGPNVGSKDDFDQTLAFRRTPDSASFQNPRKQQMFDPMTLLLQAVSQVPRETQGEMVPGMTLDRTGDPQPPVETANLPVIETGIGPVCKPTWPGDAGWTMAGENTLGLGTTADYEVWMDHLFENDEYTNYQLA